MSGEKCWLVLRRYHGSWFVMYDPVPDKDRVEWIDRVVGPFPNVRTARAYCEKPNGERFDATIDCDKNI